ncbi:unnamed protein product, partial [Oppiella nova]
MTGIQTVCSGGGKTYFLSNEGQSLVRHKSNVHLNERPYGCDYMNCGTAFKTRTHLKYHKLTHIGERPFVCQHRWCAKRFSRRHKLYAHLRTHTGEKPFRCDCGQ